MAIIAQHPQICFDAKQPVNIFIPVNFAINRNNRNLVIDPHSHRNPLGSWRRGLSILESALYLPAPLFCQFVLLRAVLLFAQLSATLALKPDRVSCRTSVFFKLG